MLKVGDAAPDFELPADTGEKVALKDFRGQKVVLYFYPKDDTPGCTMEACDFRDSLKEIAKASGAVLGVSADSVESHRKFKAKYGLTFPLLADAKREVVRSYGVLKEKSLYGVKREGVERTTFILGPDGRIAAVFPKVKVQGHAGEVLKALE